MSDQRSSKTSAEALLEEYDACWIEDEKLYLRSEGPSRETAKKMRERFNNARRAVLEAMRAAEPPPAQASKPPLPALYWYHKFPAWAAYPAESGYVPVHPNTLRSVAKILLEHHRRAEPPKETHPMLTVLTICDAYESGIGQGLANRTFDNPYDPVNDPHAYRAYGHGYDEGVKRRQPSTKSASECGACDKPGEHCANVHGICSRHGGRPHETSAAKCDKCSDTGWIPACDAPAGCSEPCECGASESENEGQS